MPILSTCRRGIAADPVEAVRRSARGLEPGDALSVSRSGSPEAEGEATVVVARDGENVAIFGLTQADDGQRLVGGGRGCVDSGIDFA